MAKKKDIILTSKNNEQLFPLAHRDFNQHILDEFYFGINGVLPANTDLNNVKKVGTYWLSSNTTYINAPEIWDIPSSSTYALLKVYKSNYDVQNKLIQEIVKIGANKTTNYYRYLNTSNVWGPWINPIGLIDEDSKVILHSDVKKCFKPWRPLKNMSFLTPQSGTYKNGVIYPCNITRGIPYSSVFFNDSDVLWNRNLNSFYSALLNPASIVYQGYIYDIINPSTVQSKSRSNYYGTMCSGFACKLLGSPIYYTTNDLRSYAAGPNNIFELKWYKDTNGINDLRIGTPLVNKGHIVFIYDLVRDESNNIIKVAVAEQRKPKTLVTYYNSVKEFETTLFYRNSNLENTDNYRVGVFKNCKPISLSNIEFNEDIIPEFGDKTWYKNGDDIWVYIVDSSATTIKYKKSNASSWSTATLSSLSTKTVNNTIMYNFKTLLTDNATYYLAPTDKYTNPYYNPCKIAIINIGNISINDSTSTATISGYSSNITPDWYQVNYIREIPEDIDTQHVQIQYPVYFYDNGNLVKSTVYDSLTEPPHYTSNNELVNYKLQLNGANTFKFNKPAGGPGGDDDDTGGDGDSSTDENIKKGYCIIVHFKHSFGSPSINLGYLYNS